MSHKVGYGEGVGTIAEPSQIKRILVVTHGGFIGEFMNVVRRLMGKPPVYSNNAKNTAMYIVQFDRNAKGGLKPKVLLENDNSHIKLELSPFVCD